MATTNYTDAITHTVLVLMKDRGLSVAGLSRSSAIGRDALESRLYSGAAWSTDQLERLAPALGVDLDVLVAPIRLGMKVPA